MEEQNKVDDQSTESILFPKRTDPLILEKAPSEPFNPSKWIAPLKSLLGKAVGRNQRLISRKPSRRKRSLPPPPPRPVSQMVRSKSGKKTLSEVSKLHKKIEARNKKPRPVPGKSGVLGTASWKSIVSDLQTTDASVSLYHNGEPPTDQTYQMILAKSEIIQTCASLDTAINALHAFSKTMTDSHREEVRQLTDLRRKFKEILK